MGADLWRAAQWWDVWQLRILVLGSLGFQWFLVLVAPLRNYTVQRWLRTSIWLACICADVLAIYALATLLYRHGHAARMASSSSVLEVLWAPLLLVHLRGREELTANNMEDTALWARHAAILVAVTVYAFFTSLPYFSDSSDGRRLLSSAALLLVAAVVSSCGKPWVLRRASVRRLVAKSSLAKGARTAKTNTKDPSACAASGWWEWCFAELGDRYKCWKELKPRGTAPMLSQGDKVQMLLSGLSLHAARATLETRKKSGSNQQILEPLPPRREAEAEAAALGRVDTIIKPCLRQAFGLMYTRATAMFTPAYLACHALLVPSLYVAAVVLFFFAASHHHKKHYDGSYSYSRADVNTTYALLCFTAALDVFGMFVSEVMYSLLSSGAAASCQNLPGHNLMDSVLWTIRRPIVSRLLLSCYKAGHFVKGKDDRLYARVLYLITKRLDKDKNYFDDLDLDLSSYRSLSKRNWILKDDEKLREVCATKDSIRDSLRKNPFDASVLIWHIATDLCFRAKPPKYFRFRPPPPCEEVAPPPPGEEIAREVCTEAISNYMAYLLNFRPEMLMAGSRQDLFTEAMANMEHIVREGTKDLRSKLREKQPFDNAILEMIKKEAGSLKDKEAYTVIHDACTLAEDLLVGVPEEKTRWELMHRVWVGMLCYSASMCRGDLHAKSLGEGGEFLSNVWLLIALIGGRTIADKLQMPDDDPEPQDKGEQKTEPEAGGKVQTPPDSKPEGKTPSLFRRPVV